MTLDVSTSAVSSQLYSQLAAETFAPVADSQWYRGMRQFWHPVAYSRDVAIDKPLGTTLLGERVVVVRTAEGVNAFEDVCRHKGASPSLGWVENGCLACPYHGWKYDMSGQLVDVPSRPDLNGVLKAALPKFRCAESAGLVWVSFADDPWGEVPSIPEWDDPTVRWQTPNFYDWKTCAPRRLENFVDFSHFPFVHENILGTRDHAGVEQHEVWREASQLRFVRYPVEPNEHRMKELLAIDEPLMTVENQYYLSMPTTIYLKRIFPNGKRYMLLMAASPTSPSTCRSFWHIGADFTASDDDDAYLLDFEDRVLAQDQPIVESQWPEHLPDALSAEMYVKVADDVTLNYRRWLFELTSQFATSSGSLASD